MFKDSQSSFISLTTLTFTDSTTTDNFQIDFDSLIISNNTLMKKDNLIEFGPINYKDYNIIMNNLIFENNTMALGNIINTFSNCK